MAAMNKNHYGTALVFGGCGYLGSHIVEALHSDGSFTSIVAASRNPTRLRIAETVYKNCDITDGAQVQKILNEVQPDVVFHSVAPSANESEEVQYRVNYVSTKQMLEIARDHTAVRAFIYTGSARSIASESHTRSSPLTEDVAGLHSLYSGGASYECTKGAADALTQEMNSPDTRMALSDGFVGMLLTVVIRVPALYGPWDFQTSARILERANTLATRIQLGNNKVNHEWLYLPNAAHVHVLAAKALLDTQPSTSSTRVDGEAFFITDGAPIKFWDFSRKFWYTAGDKRCTDLNKVRKIPMGLALAVTSAVEWVLWIFTLGRVKTNLSAAQLRYIERGSWWSIEKARDKLGYEPIYGTDESIKQTVEWYRQYKRE